MFAKHTFKKPKASIEFVIGFCAGREDLRDPETTARNCVRYKEGHDFRPTSPIASSKEIKNLGKHLVWLKCTKCGTEELHEQETN